ncbi:Uncharacterised protein [Vibrio cholerae]|nr:Uncharacterised protein [Vibrio cholerae]CSI56637.1 Uncharacterised protein [Vibrio cholerae]
MASKIPFTLGDIFQRCECLFARLSDAAPNQAGKHNQYQQRAHNPNQY